ncbi:MAG: chemotaxis protein CheC [Oscillospiraceae bacterium]|jgi:chemotaxis protein CheC|nr:chemotaxis protein CheC [Oscillospiraceae bacterium]
MPENNVMAFLEKHPDLFKEMGNIGMGHACTVLSQMLGSKVNRSIPSVWTLSRNEAAEYFDLFEGGSIGFILTLSEDIGGAVIHIVSLPFAARLIKVFFPGEINCLEDINEMCMSVIQEMGNITTAAFVNSLASMTGLFMDISTPNKCENLKEEALALAPEKLFVVENRFLVDNGTLSSELIFMPKHDSIELIAEKLCEHYELEIPT